MAAAAAGGAGGDKKKPGSAGGGKGKGKAAPAPSAAEIAAAAMADLPRYWRGKFTPLADQSIQALELEKGVEGLEDYFDKRYVRCRGGEDRGPRAFRLALVLE